MPSSSKKVPQDHKSGKKTTTRRAAPANTAQAIPVAEAPDSPYAPNTWLNSGIGGLEDLQVPSGQMCLVKRPGLEGLMTAGVLQNVDSLSQIVNEKHLKRVDGKPQANEIDIRSLMADQEGLDEVTNVIDRVVCHVVVKPEVHRAPNDVTLRQRGVVYTDMIDLMDKMFIFNYVVGGTRDLETFRGEVDESVGGVESGEGVSQSA